MIKFLVEARGEDRLRQLAQVLLQQTQVHLILIYSFSRPRENLFLSRPKRLQFLCNPSGYVGRICFFIIVQETQAETYAELRSLVDLRRICFFYNCSGDLCRITFLIILQKTQAEFFFVQAIQYSRQEYVEEYVSIFQTVDLVRISVFINLQ